MTIDRVRLIYKNGEVAVRDFAFSQICELTRDFTKEQNDIFWNRMDSVTTEVDSFFAKAGTNVKYMGAV